MVDSVPVEGNPFAQSDDASATAAPRRPEGYWDGRGHINMGRAPQQLASEPVDHDPFANQDSALAGNAKQFGVGIAKGAIGIPGMAGDLANAAVKVDDWATQKAADWVKANYPGGKLEQFANWANSREDTPDNTLPITSEDIQHQVEKVTGPFRQPQNQTEADFQTAGEFLPSMLLNQGGVVSRAVQAAVPAATTIIAGRFSDQNPYVKALAGVLGGVGASSALTPRSLDNFLRDKLPSFVTPQHVDDAGQLIQRTVAAGGKLTWPEALSQVTGRPVLTDLQRVLESDSRTRDAMGNFMADRPKEMQGIARNEIANVGPAAQNPHAIGPAAQEAAQETVAHRQAQINAVTRPMYQAAETQRVGPAVHNALTSDPLYAQTLKEVRSNPELGRTIEHLPDDSVGVIDLVQRRMRERAENARVPGENSTSNLAAANLEDARTVPLAAADTLTGSRPATATTPAISGSYETARAWQSYLRQRYLEPMMAGPIGKIAKSDGQVRSVINHLFSADPEANSARAIGEAITQIEARRPGLGQAIVRQYLEGVLNSSAKALQSGDNQFVGAKFWKDLVGHPQMKANLQAAMEALPNGKARWRALEDTLQIMEATGKRQQKGSLTAYNAEDRKMGGTDLIAKASQLTKLSKWQSFLNDTYMGWAQGRNYDTLMKLITDPKSGPQLERLANMPTTMGGRAADRASGLLYRLLTQGTPATTDFRNPGK